MPVSSLIAWLGALRQVDAGRRLSAFHEAVIAARGNEEGVRSVSNALGSIANPTPRARGGLKDLERMLGGGA